MEIQSYRLYNLSSVYSKYGVCLNNNLYIQWKLFIRPTNIHANFGYEIGFNYDL